MEKSPSDAAEPTTASPTIIGSIDSMAVIKADQKVAVSVRGRDEAGNPVPIGGPDDDISVVFALDNTTVATLVDNGDGTAVVTAVGPIGTATLTADATRASDGQVFHGVAAVEVVAGDVESISLEFAAPEESTPDTP